MTSLDSIKLLRICFCYDQTKIKKPANGNLQELSIKRQKKSNQTNYGLIKVRYFLKIQKMERLLNILNRLIRYFPDIGNFPKL